MTATTPTTQTLDLDAIRARAAAATEGPWIEEYSGEAGTCVLPHDAESTREAVARTFLYAAQADAVFIANARTDVPALIAEVKALRARITGAQDALKGPRAGENVMRAWDSAIIRARKALAGDAT